VSSEQEVGVATQSLLAGSEWASAGKFTHIYDPSVGETGPWYFNDHTFFRDPATGLWHLYGITDDEPIIPLAYDVDAADQFGHATAPTLLGPWTKQPFIMHSSQTPPYNESHLWAPHVVAHQGTYYMFYSGGGPDETNYEISLATSTDLNTWVRDPAGPLFRDGFQARDPMVIRADNKWIMYYTATLTAQGGKYVVAYRTASNLRGPWSARQIAFTDPMSGTDAGPTESPFVVQRGNWFYLFLGPRPYHLYIPPDYPGSDVFASTTPYSFNTAQQVGHIGAHAAEVIADGPNLYVSDAGWALGGVYLAPLSFHSAPVSGTALYARYSNNVVKRWSGSGTQWTQIGNTWKQLVTGGFGTFGIHATTNDIHRYDSASNTWPRMGGPRTAFAVNATALYARDSEGIYKWTGGAWDKIGNAAANIYAGGNDVYARFSSDGDIFRYVASEMPPWVKIGGPGTTWAANTNGIYGLNGWGVFQWTGSGTEWVQVGGAADKLYAGGNALYATVPFFGDLNYYSNSPDTWSKAANSATSYAVCDNALYSLRSNGVYKQATTNAGTLIGATAASIACGK